MLGRGRRRWPWRWSLPGTGRTAPNHRAPILPGWCGRPAGASCTSTGVWKLRECQVGQARQASAELTGRLTGPLRTLGGSWPRSVELAAGLTGAERPNAAHPGAARSVNPPITTGDPCGMVRGSSQSGEVRHMVKPAKKPLPPAAPTEAEDAWGFTASDFFGFRPFGSPSADPPPAAPDKPATPAKPARKRAAARGSTQP